MRTFDMTPLFRTTVGYDRMARLFDALANEPAPSYPPYNIEKQSDDAYRISMAVAGFAEEDLEIRTQENALVISGKKDEQPEEAARYLHRGIAERAFERRFTLADHIRVAGATLENGLLHVDLVREVPEALKPRTIEIAKGDAPKSIENQAEKKAA